MIAAIPESAGRTRPIPFRLAAGRPPEGPSLAPCNADGAEHVSWLRRIDP
jgi:hypothetical protein